MFIALYYFILSIVDSCRQSVILGEQAAAKAREEELKLENERKAKHRGNLTNLAERFSGESDDCDTFYIM